MRKEEIHTVEVEYEEDGRHQVGDECSEKVDDSLLENKLPERKRVGGRDQPNCSDHQQNQVERHS